MLGRTSHIRELERLPGMRTPFEQAVTDHGAVVLRVCRAVLGATDAEDAWSETFLAALRAWPDLPDDANVRAWLVTIAPRKALDVVRAAVAQNSSKQKPAKR